MEFGSLMVYLIEGKHISLEEICRDEWTRSFLQSIIQNEGTCTTANFVQLLQRLNVEYDEFQYLLNQQPRWEDLFWQALDGYYNDDDKIFNDILNVCQQYKTIYSNDKFQHLEDLIEIWQKRKLPKQAILVQYLQHLELWTYYEIRMLSYLLLSLDFDLGYRLYRKSKKRLVVYKKYRHYREEGLWLDLQFVLFCLHHHKWQYVEPVLQKINREPLSEYCLTERILCLIISDIWQLLQEPHNIGYHERFKQDLVLLERLNCHKITEKTMTLFVRLLAELPDRFGYF